MTDIGKILDLVLPATGQTCLMVLFSTIFSLILGFPLGVLLCVSDPFSGIKPRKVLFQVLTRIVNALRSFPFIILMILLFPLSRIIVGKTIGTAATVVPLSVAAAPFVARIIENSLKEVDTGVIQAARAMGSTTMQIIANKVSNRFILSIVYFITINHITLIEVF